MYMYDICLGCNVVTTTLTGLNCYLASRQPPVRILPTSPGPFRVPEPRARYTILYTIIYYTITYYTT